MLLCNSESEVVLSNPGYACYRNFVLAAQAKPVLVPLSEEKGLQYDIEAIRKCVNQHTAAIFINSPMNPTGMLLEESFLKEVAALGVPVISDEIYHGLVYEGRAHSILEYTDQAFVLNGFSKRFAMTGLRLGYLTEILYAFIAEVATESVYLRIQCCPAGGNCSFTAGGFGCGTYEAGL